MKKYKIIDSDIVKLNVGGQKFSIHKSNLTKKCLKPNQDEFCEPNLLQGLISGIADIKYDEEKAIFIDRSPKYFDEILTYLRMENTDEIFELPNNFDDQIGMLKEAEYYKIESLTNLFKLFGDSSILSRRESLELINLCGFSLKDKWKLIYRGNVHGFSSKDFHEKCDPFKRTLIIVESTHSNIFGGFTNATWDGYKWKFDLDSFIFSLVNRQNKPIKIKYDNVSSPNTSIMSNPSMGPQFGNSFALRIANNPNVNQLSDSNLGNNFKHPQYDYDSDEAKCFLAGSPNFQVREIEVYHLI